VHGSTAVNVKAYRDISSWSNPDYTVPAVHFA